MNGKEIKAQDIVVSLKLAMLPPSPRPTYATLAASLAMSASEVHGAVKRAQAAKLINQMDSTFRVDRRNLLELGVTATTTCSGPKAGVRPDRGGRIPR